MATAALTRYTPEEYLALERDAEFRNEYLNGRIVAKTGADPEHADVVLTLREIYADVEFPDAEEEGAGARR